nr:immunoglobulin light chain junction region [Macaca mulatta]
CQQQNTYPRTF